jgi:hypothetical protein
VKWPAFQKYFSKVSRVIYRDTNNPYTGACIQITISCYLSIYYSHEFIGNTLGSIWTFNVSRSHWYQDRCVTLSQDNHNCEVCHTPSYDGYICFPKEGELYRRSRKNTHKLPVWIEYQYWQIKWWCYVTKSSISLGYIIYSTLLQSLSLHLASRMWYIRGSFDSTWN